MIDPVAFEIGPLQLHWYGIIIASAVLIGGLLGTRVAMWLNEDPEDGWSMLLLGEQLSPAQWAGVGLVLVGILIYRPAADRGAKV